MNADSIPRYAPPAFDELADERTPEQMMQTCVHGSACIRIIERFKGVQFRSTDDEWRYVASVAGCADCLEYE